ncbi:DUF6765 family protein [Acinetobacter sp. ABJ_C1_1]|uniref:DUF6765 family protein n=1 Tax=Acinetobacter sp. ABJ_C1_1 TaxID=3378321 RepID=UPI0037DD920E
MKNLIFTIGSVSLGLATSLNSLPTHAGVVDFSQCSANSSFAIVTQSEGPTYACGGLDTGVGNPINVLNGNKFEAINDFKELPAFKGLSFSRFYNSQSHADTALGYGWYSSFDIKLYEQPDIIQIRLESGQRINFKKNKIPLGNNQFIIRALPLNPNDGWIEKKIDGSAWVWHKTQTGQEYFFQYLGGQDPSLAHITKISASTNDDQNHPSLNFSFVYDQQQRLVAVKNGQGQQLSFQHTTTRFGLPQITVITPIGKYYYFLDRNHNLAQVVYPDGRRFKYVYDPKFQGGDIHNLTSKWQFNQSQKKFKLISQWQYDNQDRAVLSQHANGVEKVSIQYDARTHQNMPATYAGNKPVFKNIVTNSLGQKTTYSYQIDGTQFHLLESFGAGCSSCGEVNKRYRFNAQGLVNYAADLDSTGKVIRAIDLKYNDHGEVIAKTVSGTGLTSQTTTYEYESYPIQQGNQHSFVNPLLTQLDKQDFRRLKAESHPSVVSGKQYRKSYTYNQNNQLIAIKETGFSPVGETLVRETRYGYDAQGRLSWEDGPLPNGKTNSPKDSDVRIFQYNNAGQLQSLELPGQQKIQVLSFDPLNRPKNVKITDGSRSVQIDLSYYNSGLEVSKYVYHADNQIHSIENHFDEYGQLISTKNGLQQTNFDYDVIGRLIKTQNPNGLTHTRQYNSENIVTNEITTDQYGKLIQSLDHKFNVSNDTLSVEATDTLGLLSKTFQSGMFIEQQDALKRRFIQQVDGLGRAVSSQLQSPNNQLISSTNSSFKHGHASQYSAGLQQNKWMDDFGRTIATQSPGTGVKLYRFNEVDLAVEIIDEKGLIQKNKYDYAHRLIESSIKNPQNQAETIIQKTEFDGSKPIRQTSQDEVQLWQYAQDGKLLHHTTAQLDTSPGNKHIQPINFITQPQLLNKIDHLLFEKRENKDLPISSWAEDYEYDKNGLLSKEIRRDLTIHYDRDTLGKITSLQLTKNGKTASVDQIQWNSTGQLTHYRLSTNQQLWRTYDSRGRLIQQRWYSPRPQSWWERLIVKIKYQWLGQSLPESEIQTSNYVYDQANRLIYSNESGHQFYQYDDKDQLIAIWNKNTQTKRVSSWYPVQVYAYDAQGNRHLQWQKAEKQNPETIHLYRYGKNGDASVQLLGVSQHIVHQGEMKPGQLTRIAAYTPTGQPHIWWQAEPQQINTVLDYVPSANSGAPLWDTSSTSWRGTNDQNHNVSIDQQFNQQGLISKRAVAFNTQNQQREFSQRNGYVNGIRMWEQQRLRMPNETISDIHAPEIQDVVVDRDYVILAGLPVMQFSQISTQKQNEQLDTASASFNAVQFNRIGAPVKVYDENNTTRWQTDYSPFGERLNTVSTHNNEAKLIRVADHLPISQSIDDLRYMISIRLPGQNEDPITGLYDNGHRQYDPTVGRYLTPDPMGTVDGLNPYLYVGNNPLNKVDPYGLYQTDMHYYMTYFLAITAGIDSDNARRIALATQFVDTNDNTSPFDDEAGPVSSLYNNFRTQRLEYYHFTNNRFAKIQPFQGMELGSWDLEKPKGMSDADYLKWRLTSNLNNIPQLIALTTNYNKAAECGNLNLSMQFFGEYLHAFEDTFAHRDQNNDPFGVNAGFGHGAYGSNPDFTFNHYGQFNIPQNLVGYGDWTVNETRSLLEQEKVYDKLVKYRNTVLNTPDSEVKVVPWNELKSYLAIYNAIPEKLDYEAEVGSLDKLSEKITYLQALLNGSPINQKIYAYNSVKKENELIQTQSIKTNWGYKPKKSEKFELIKFIDKDDNQLFDKNKNAASGYVADKDGYLISQAITNRIEVFRTLSKADKEKYTNLVWDTSVQKYIDRDAEGKTIESAIQNYRLSTKSISNLQSSPFTITGTPPVTK